MNVRASIVLYWLDNYRRRQIYSNFYKHKTDVSDSDGAQGLEPVAKHEKVLGKYCRISR